MVKKPKQNSEENQQELVFKLSMFEQQIQQLQQQLQAVEQGIVEMNSLDLGLDELVGSKGKEILAPIGRGIFVKTRLLDEKLSVDIGEKKFIKKSIPDTKKIIKEQIKKLEEVKSELTQKMEETSGKLQQMLMDVQAKEMVKGKEK